MQKYSIRIRFLLIFAGLLPTALIADKTRDYLNLPLRPTNAALGGQLGHSMPTQAAAMVNPAYLGYGDQNTFFAGGLGNSALSGFFFDGALFSPFGGLGFSAEYLKAEDRNIALSFSYGSFLSRRIATGLSVTPRYVVLDGGTSAFGFGLDPALIFDSKWHKSVGEHDGFGLYSPSVFVRTQNLSIPIGERTLLATPSAHVGFSSGIYQSAQFNWALMFSTYGTDRFDKLPLIVGTQTNYRWAFLSLGYGMSHYSTTANGFALGVGAQVPLSFGDAYLFYSLNFANSNRADLHALTAGVRLGGVDSDPPQVDFVSEGKHFSPNNDGVRDAIQFKAQVSDRSPIVFYELVIRDLKGNIVYRQKSDERLREKDFSWPLFFRSFVSPRARADIPERFAWNGKIVTEKKKIVKDNVFDDETVDTPLADGVYSFEFRVMDEKNNESRPITGEVIIDTKPPAATVELGDDLISPNGDGRRDVLTITQDTAAGDSYEAEIIDANGEKIRTYSWPQAAPTRVEFDGRRGATTATSSQLGELAEEGVYRYRLTGRDAAGNYKTVTSANFYVSRRVDAVLLKSSAAGFNPAQKKFAEISLAPSVEFPEGFVEGEILVSRKCGAKSDDVVYRFVVPAAAVDKKKPATKKNPVLYTWRGEAASQTRAPDGIYCVVFRARYENGNAPESPPIKIVLDSAPPELEISADLSVREFTPDGDGENEEQPLRLFAKDLSQIASYEILIHELIPDSTRATKPVLVRRFQGQGEIPLTVYWDGKTESGGLVESLTQYEYTLTAADIYGNSATTQPRRFETGALATTQGSGLLIRVPGIDLEEPVSDRLAAVYKIVARYPKYKIKIEVHGSGGGIEKNLRSTEAAARKIYDYFLDRGVAAERLTYQGFGDSTPVFNARSVNATKNRRLDLLLSR